MKTNWLAALFVMATDVSTRLRQNVWRWVYNKIAARDPSGKFLFMNYGFDEGTGSALYLKPEDEPFRPFIQLYNHVICELNLQNKDLLEVGCGRGGGAAFLIRYKNPHSFIGVDLSENAIDWCRKQHHFKNTHWLQGVADALPVVDQSIDVVINVESSHCYPSIKKFLSEVKRTLRPGGYLALCDLRSSSEIKSLNESLQDSGLKLLKQQEITASVVNALDLISNRRDAEITASFPTLLRPAVRDFAAVKDTVLYNRLKTGQMQYYSYLLQK